MKRLMVSHWVGFYSEFAWSCKLKTIPVTLRQNNGQHERVLPSLHVTLLSESSQTKMIVIEREVEMTIRLE